MIDIDKYEGTNWDLRGQFTHTEMADEVLLLLAEVKRLQKQRNQLQSIMSNHDGVWIDEDDLNERVKELIE